VTQYYVRSTSSNTSPYDTWAKAATTLATVLALATNADIADVSQAHAETQAAALTLTCPVTPGLEILCGNDGAAPITALAATGTISCSGNAAYSITGHAYFYGLSFIAGSAGQTGNASALQIAAATNISHGQFYDTCKFQNLTTGATSTGITLGVGASSTGKDCTVDIKNSSFRVGNVAQGIALQSGRIHLTNITLDAAGSIPTTLFIPRAGCYLDVVVEASDLSGRAFTNLVTVAAACSGKITFRDCKLPASINVTTGTFPGPGGLVIEMWNCDSGNTNYRFARWSYEGSTIDEHTIVKTGGATDGVTANSFKMVSTSGAPHFWQPLYSPEIAQKIATTGSALTATVDIVHDSVTNLKDTEVWLEVEYLSSSGAPLGAVLTDRAADILAAGADQTASSAAWTTTGLTNPNKQKLEVTFTPQQKGYVLLSVALAKSNYTIYADNAPAIA